jgi:hypothetical protein
MQQAANHKSVLPYYYLAHMANYGWWPTKTKHLAHFRNHLKSTITYNLNIYGIIFVSIFAK